MDGMIAFSSNGATWYISAMLLSMLILVPLFLKNKDLFLYVIAPLITLAVFGYLYQTTGTLRGIKEWMGICLKGPLRAIGVMCLGCVCYVVCQKMREWSYTRLAQALLSIVEIGGYVFAIYWMYGHEASEMEFVIAVIFAVSVTISFSRKGLLSPLFDNKVVYWLGTFSFPLFLSHHFWSMRMRKLFPKQTYRELLPKYFLLAIVTAFAIYFISKGIRKWYAKYGDRVKAIFVLRCRL
jgi:peptidoglycan/LPS O-acetylase OafA/YrhL